MQLIFAICCLLISSSLGCPPVARPLNEAAFKNIISEGKWHVMLRYKSEYDKSLDTMIDTALYTEFEFLDGFPYECRIQQRCLDRNVNRSISIMANITLSGLLNFVKYKDDSAKFQSVGVYSYALYKYEPNRLLILYSCTSYSKTGLLVLHKVDAKGLRREVEIESVLAGLQLDEINVNETTTVSLNEGLECPQRFLDWYWTQNEVVGNPRGNWRLALVNLVLCKVLLQIFWD